MEDQSYVKQLKERWTQYRQESYSNEHIEATIDSITKLLHDKEALERNNTAWNMFKNTTYEMEISKLKQWISNRIAWMDEQLDYVSTANIKGIKTEHDSFLKKNIVGYYNLSGFKINYPKTGDIIIIKYCDGTTQKLFIK